MPTNVASQMDIFAIAPSAAPFPLPCRSLKIFQMCAMNLWTLCNARNKEKQQQRTFEREKNVWGERPTAPLASWEFVQRCNTSVWQCSAVLCVCWSSCRRFPASHSGWNSLLLTLDFPLARLSPVTCVHAHTFGSHGVSGAIGETTMCRGRRCKTTANEAEDTHACCAPACLWTMRGVSRWNSLSLFLFFFSFRR